MPDSHKKVVVRRFAAESIPGYLPATGFVVNGAVDLLGLDGRRSQLPLDQVHSVAFVREFALADSGSGERAARRFFTGRPRNAGLWLRITFRDTNEQLEGLVSSEISLADDLLQDRGFFLTPPDTRGNTQRLYIPRLAIAALEVLGVIRGAAGRQERATTRPGKRAAVEQDGLFDVAETTPGSVTAGKDREHDSE